MSMTYTSLLSDFSEELDPTRLHSVFIPRNAQILFRKCQANIDLRNQN